MVSVVFNNAEVCSIGGKEYLMLEIDANSEKKKARKYADEKRSKPYVAEIREYRSKRSSEANNKAWLLISKLASELGLNPLDVYRRHVEEIGKHDQYLMLEGAFEEFSNAWSYGHIGRYAKIIGESREKKGFVWVAAFHGSSSYDTKTMYHFMDNIIQECKNCDIETLSPAELEELMEAWQAKEQEH